MSFGDHLNELRSRLIKALVASVIAVIVAAAWAEDIVRLIVGPFQKAMRAINANPALIATGPTQPFITYFKAALIAGLIASAPVWIYQVWAFIAAGLYRHERRWVFRFAPLSLLLFCGGVTFGYAVLLPVALRYLLTFASPDLIQNWISISEYSSLFTTLTLLLGIAFQLPVIMLGLAKAGIIPADGFRRKRRITILLIFIVAGIITPPDPITQPLVAVPLCLLYELGIGLAWLAEGRKAAPVDWRKWRRRGAIAAAVLGVVFLFRERIANVWRGAQADDRTLSATADALPWAAVAQAALGAPADGGMRVNDDGAEPVVVAAAAGRVAAFRFRRSADPAVVVDPAGSGFRVTSWRAGATVWAVERPDDLLMRDVFEPVVGALRVGGEEARRAARAILEAASGARLPVEDAAAAEAAAAWLAPKAAERFLQAR